MNKHRASGLQYFVSQIYPALGTCSLVLADNKFVVVLQLQTQKHTFIFCRFDKFD